MVGGGDVKVATVEAESVDNMATLPVSRAHGGGGSGGGGSDVTAEKNNVTNKEMELKKVRPQPPKRTSLFIIMSFIYAKLLVVICIAYVISEVVTHKLPLHYYEGFFTYLYGTSILFLLYVFCFLLQESKCCTGGDTAANAPPRPPPPPPSEKKKSKEKEKEKEKEKKAEKAQKQQQQQQQQQGEAQAQEQAARNKGNVLQMLASLQREVYPRKMKDLLKLKQQLEQNPDLPLVQAQGVLRNLRSSKDVNLNDGGGGESPSQEKLAASEVSDVEAARPQPPRKRKTSQNVHSHGSFFLRVGAIAFGLGTMIYNGLECGAFFEIPFTSPCYQILRGINPVLQMIFTFMQMYFIFMNSRLNIHRFKVLARFGLMHIVATNLCVWIRTLVLESLKEITTYQNGKYAQGIFASEGTTPIQQLENFRELGSVAHTAAPTLAAAAVTTPSTTTTTTTARAAVAQLTTSTLATTLAALQTTLSTTLSTTSTTTPTTTPTTTSTVATTTSTTTMPPTTSTTASTATFTSTTPVSYLLDFEDLSMAASNPTNVEHFPALFPEALTSNLTEATTPACERVNIMGSIVQDSAPYLFPFIIEYSLIGAAVIYVMWRHIGRNPRYTAEEDLEHRLEVMLSRRAVAMAHAQHGRVDCVGASKGLFFGLLLLVGSLICLILFFVLVQHQELGRLAIYLADVSHCVLMALSIVAIIIGFIRVQSLKFRAEEQSDLNDILLRVSAFGLFVYAVFSVIAGSLGAFTHEPNLLVMITGLLSVLQVVLQLLFIADVARRRVHLPEQDRSKPGRQVVTFLLICNVTMWVIYTFETQKVVANPVQLKFYGFLAWAIVQRVTLPLCIFHRFHSAVTLAEIWKTSYKARLD